MQASCGTVGKQSYPREGEQFDQFELPVSREEFTWKRQGLEAVAVMSSRETLPVFAYNPDSGLD